LLINSKGKEYNTFGGGHITVDIMGLSWWDNLHKRRVANKLPARQVWDESVKKEGKEIQKNPLTKIRYIDKKFEQFQETIIVGDYVAITVFSENPYAFLIKIPKLLKVIENIFNFFGNLLRNNRVPKISHKGMVGGGGITRFIISPELLVQ
jgi:hypothetical protein